MHPMKLGSAAGLAMLVSFAAQAADLRAPVYRMAPAVSGWSGFYVGFNGGYGWADSSMTSAPIGAVTAAGIRPIPAVTASQNLNGPLFGGHVGYNYQIASWVVGGEGDFDWTGLNNSSALVLPDPLLGGGSDGFMAHQQVQWLASLRGRLGYAWGSSLLYVTGGAAWEKHRTSVLVSADTAPGIFSESAAASFSNTRSGWVIGAGYEWMIAPSWVVRGEYLHYDFRDDINNPILLSCRSLGPAGACGVNVTASNNRMDVLRLGLSYKFDHVAIPGVFK
jgi:outer membrane immunogenic protein